MTSKKQNLELSDQELVLKLKEDVKYLGVVYENYKSKSILFLKRYSKNLKHIELSDVFSESCYELYKNFALKNKPLSEETSLQTYLNAICLNQLRKTLIKELDENGSIKNKNKSNPNNVLSNEKNEIQDRLSNINYSINNFKVEWLKEEFDHDFDRKFQDDNQKKLIKNAFVKLKENGGHCAELLVLFWWRKRSMKELTVFFGYKNERVTIQQKAKCQKRLSKLIEKNKQNGI